MFPVVPVYGRSGANIIFLVDRVEKAWNKRKWEKENGKRKSEKTENERSIKKKAVYSK